LRNVVIYENEKDDLRQIVFRESEGSAYSAQITTVEDVRNTFDKRVRNGPIPLVCTSGAFDPLCVGELKSMQTAAMLKGDNGLFVVIVNGDGFLERKKGFVFMPLIERMELIASLKGVDYVVPWDDGTQTVIGALEIIRPNMFAKGGSKRSNSDSVPEYNKCLELGCTVVFGMGGFERMKSSSTLVAKMKGDAK
jgi:bifunctional ADP-heptose synthase (sugar kinase/adenylyltransferase)